MKLAAGSNRGARVPKVKARIIAWVKVSRAMCDKRRLHEVASFKHGDLSFIYFYSSPIVDRQ
jgi:hypothetical protein